MSYRCGRCRERGTEIIWPIWSHPLPRATIETLIAQTQDLDAAVLQ